MTAMNGNKRTPRKITAPYLHNAATHYLERFASSSENLRWILLRKVDRSARFHGSDPDEGSDLVNAIIGRFQLSGLLDDRADAEARVANLRRRGDSSRAIRAKLAQKGIARELIEAALETNAEDHPDAELAAAVALARRRRLGPYRLGAREEMREKDLAVLGRAGFAYDTALTVVNALSSEELESAH